MYIFVKCYMGFCTPKRTIMDSKKKKKTKKKQTLMHVAPLGPLDPNIEGEEMAEKQFGH